MPSGRDTVNRRCWSSFNKRQPEAISPAAAYRQRSYVGKCMTTEHCSTWMHGGSDLDQLRAETKIYACNQLGGRNAANYIMRTKQTKHSITQARRILHLLAFRVRNVQREPSISHVGLELLHE